MKKPRIVFLPVPESLRGQLENIHGDEELNGGNFLINQDILIPVEIPPTMEKIKSEEISPQMILSGMLHVIKAGEKEQKWIEYYRNFVLAMRPGILEEFTKAAFIKAHNGDYDMAIWIFDVLCALFPPPSQYDESLALSRALVMELQFDDESST